MNPATVPGVSRGLQSSDTFQCVVRLIETPLGDRSFAVVGLYTRVERVQLFSAPRYTALLLMAVMSVRPSVCPSHS